MVHLVFSFTENTFHSMRQYVMRIDIFIDSIYRDLISVLMKFVNQQ